MKSIRLIVFFLVSFFLFGILHAQPLKIIVTGDMHGWLEPRAADGKIAGGAAEMLAYWKIAEGYSPGKFLVISCGDIATGPAVSSVFKGEPAVAAMNMMGYDVSGVGNHEFDFGGVGSLIRMKGWAKFPFIAANIALADGSPVDNIQPAMMYEEQGIKVGVIGLTLQNLAGMTQASDITGLPYAECVRKYAAELRANGAKTVIVVSHVPQAELCVLAKEVADLNIPLMLGGHTHEVAQQKIGNTLVVSCGKWWECYGRIDLEVDPENGSATAVESKQVWLLQKTDKALSDPDVKAETGRWREKMIKEYGERLGFTVTGLSRKWTICNLATDAWLSAYPADLAICNLGAFRKDLPPGEIHLYDLIEVMPFDNSLLRMKITGGRLKNYAATMKKEILVFGGAKRKGDDMTLISSGKMIDPPSEYKLLINSYLYGISPELEQADPNPEKISGDWRAPVVEWLKVNPTCADRPVEGLVDSSARIE